MTEQQLLTAKSLWLALLVSSVKYCIPQCFGKYQLLQNKKANTDIWNKKNVKTVSE